MQIKESINIALSAVSGNKLRSILTLLGITVGVFSIITVMTSMRVLQNNIESGLQFLGAHTFQVQRMPAIQRGHATWREYRHRPIITYEQGRAVRDLTTSARAVNIQSGMWGRVVQSEFGQTNPNVAIFGQMPDGIHTNNLIVEDGRGIMEQDIEFSQHIAVIGRNVAERVFPNTYPIGREIRLEGERFIVVGIYEERGSFLGGEQDNYVVIPLTTFFKLYGKNRSVNIMVQSKDAASYLPALEEVRGILRTARKVPPGSPDNFEIFSNDSLIEEFNNITFYVRAGIAFISFIALIAAGVGIMNIMLVSVTERTKEIGIRKAVGARKSSIMKQFIMEAIVLCQIGGIAGIILGVIAGNVLAIILSVPAAFPYDWAVIGITICTLVGLIFGVYPAWKAATLDPIEALRYE